MKLKWGSIMSETYLTRGLKCSLHGVYYQKLWLMLFFRRAVDRKDSFRLATEMDSAAGFDDIVFRYKQNGVTVDTLIQIKHKENNSEKICVSDLLTRSGKFDLAKHFSASLKIQSNEEFKGERKDFFFVTNADFDYADLASKKIIVKKIWMQDDFLSIGNGSGYKLIDYGGKIAEYLKKNKIFINDKLGREDDEEIHDEEIKDFLNELVFVVNLPDDDELEELIKNEISNDLTGRFQYFGDDNFVFNALSTMISNWMKESEGHFLTPEEGREFFREVEKLPSTLSEIKFIVTRAQRKVDEIVGGRQRLKK